MTTTHGRCGFGRDGCRVGRQPSRLRSLWPAVLALDLVLSSCVSTQVEYFTDEHFSPTGTGTQVQWLTAEPSEPYLKIARITVDSTSADPNALRQAIRARARQLGADAVIDERSAMLTSRAASPNYESGVLGPKGAAFGLYGYGWYAPYSSDPYLLTQGATDQPKVNEYMSGIAIRYQRVSGDSK